MSFTLPAFSNEELLAEEQIPLPYSLTQYFPDVDSLLFGLSYETMHGKLVGLAQLYLVTNNRPDYVGSFEIALNPDDGLTKDLLLENVRKIANNPRELTDLLEFAVQGINLESDYAR